MSHFIGLTMLVTLKFPPGTQLRGKISSVTAGQSLTLRNVYCLGDGRTITDITIQASDIADLVEAVDENTNPRSAGHSVHVPVPPQLKTFEDPAILSVGRRPLTQVPALNTAPPTKANSRFHSPKISPPPPSLLTRSGSSRRRSQTSITRGEKDSLPVVGLVGPVSNIKISNGREDDTGNISDVKLPVNTGKRRKSHRGVRGRGAKRTSEANDSLPKLTPGGETNRGNGWRQTPLLEPSFQPFTTLKTRSRKGGYDNGWATEDATDVQELGDFDFESGLAKFDKRSVFEGIRADDMTADENRLVSHNRLPKPSAAGGKNLHHTENVLDNTVEKSAWNSRVASSNEGDGIASHRDTGSGRTSRRAESTLRKPLSRKEPPINPSQHVPSSTRTSISTKPSFYLTPANRRCEVVSPLQMLNVENIANGELGLTEDMMTENAARGIAEVALKALKLSGRRLSQASNNSLPYVVVYAGNNKSGVRSVGAGRHLRTHGINVVVCVLGLERESTLLEGLRGQLKIFRSFGGKVLTKVELMDYMKSLELPVELIIDGLLGLTISFEELRTGDQSTAYELIEWANRSKANIIAIDIPTGIDPTSGKVSVIDGQPLYMHAKYVVAMGAPKKGLLQTMYLGEGVNESRQWQLFVADLGIANQAWKKAGTRMRRGVEFEETWVIEMRFHKGFE